MSAHVYSENFASKGFYASFLKTSMDSFCQISHNEDLFYFKESCQQKRIHGLFSPVMFRRNSSLFIDLQPMFKIAFPAHHFLLVLFQIYQSPFPMQRIHNPLHNFNWSLSPFIILFKQQYWKHQTDKCFASNVHCVS